ncbi:MAG: acetolactate synthase, large subunit, biosynthetic type [Bacteroidetes bacterium CG12_big_fil_rev_8_21_14_0_65_60_17]|nr:MAG: acetolactate synthase, large subunit, biosynthetic type [Bacteroidetes bacterium CG12_big_fil_rev_8_21_14_0_65_60_17]
MPDTLTQNPPAPESAPTDRCSRGVPVSGAEILIRSLEAEGVEFVFGYPGGAVIKIYDEMHRIGPQFEHVLVRHEQGAAHAAEGYAKATGNVGTVLVTSGPGATNTVTGIADAYMDSIPIVVFTGQVPTKLIGNDAFQECDIIGVTRSITKHSFLVRDVRELASTVKKAYHIARTGRPGPVVVDLPKDVIADSAPFEWPEHVTLRGYDFVGRGEKGQVALAARMIAEAERPLFYVGGGTLISGAGEIVTRLARMTRIPVTTTLHGLGAFPETDPLSLGMLGMHGTWYANQAVQHCDLLIAVGARFDDRVTGKTDAWAPHARIIHIDIDPACISKNIPADCPILGDVSTVLEQLEPLLPGASRAPKDLSRWHRQIDTWKAECPLAWKRDGKLRPQHVVEALRDRTGGHAIVVSDVGQNQMWAAQHFTYAEPRSHITSGGLGTMGFSLPAAMGAAFGVRARAERGQADDTQAAPALPVISINGDGGFLMNVQELGVIAAHKLPVKIVVLNNSFLGMVRQWQELFHGERYSHTDLTPTNPDFVALAAAFGIPGLRCTSPDAVEATISKAWDITDGPVLMEFRVVTEEMVFPMVPAGAATGDMIVQRFNPENCA